MAVSILLVTHNEIGDSLLKTAITTFGELPLSTRSIGINYKNDPNEMAVSIEKIVNEIDQGEGVLVLTDMFGSTPCNIAQKLRDLNNVQVISGINLPMVIRVMNYPQLPLDLLAEKALSAGREGVMKCIIPSTVKSGPLDTHKE
jgi:mannose PTS system EIIA component